MTQNTLPRYGQASPWTRSNMDPCPDATCSALPLTAAADISLLARHTNAPSRRVHLALLRQRRHVSVFQKREARYQKPWWFQGRRHCGDGVCLGRLQGAHQGRRRQTDLQGGAPNVDPSRRSYCKGCLQSPVCERRQSCPKRNIYHAAEHSHHQKALRLP
ncbi:hypothetical protein B0H17DRAFT_1174284 [Mycena rosella]|uniref:Uncharacterized protein n=1 Tax=Mycena rosella TaxID=1033263 RepID=A0AAD7GYB8_MYCRO|nr:hypothetical protein B0H17DRAFT_1174284 [Mycena rosella]